MTKKPQGRAARQRSRTGARPVANRPAPLPNENGEASAGTAASVSQRPVTSAAPSRPLPRRPVAPARPQPTLTFNYAYLGHDITSLAILAPAMVVLLIVAYFVLH